ncbi:DUF4124 domain-containing protein [Pseudomonas sp. F1_0610]|uniref:DUF4124 domain-containing protein n=1 Tax=Pseudomonas sp. F1_0610 TaxID=3114284 RepID=UPI0039C291BC
MMKWKFLIGLLVAVTSSNVVAEIYRYKDEKGLTVLNRQGVPSQYIGNGYDVLNEAGRVIRVVPRALTAEERIEQERLQAQETNDLQLIRLYPTVRDLERAKERKITDIDGQISTLKNNLLSVQSKRDSLQQRAAESERSGSRASQSMLNELAELDKDKETIANQIRQTEELKKNLLLEFSYNAERIKQLTNRP